MVHNVSKHYPNDCIGYTVKTDENITNDDFKSKI